SSSHATDHTEAPPGGHPLRSPGPPANLLEAAVGAAHDAEALRIGAAGLDRVRDARLDVLDSVLAQGAVVEVHEPLAETGGAADVGREDRDAVGEERLVRAVEARPLLPFRSSVVRQHHWIRRRSRRTVDQAGVL